MFISCIIIILSLLHYFNNVFALLAVNTYVSFFEIGLGPIPWLIVAEMFDAKYVAVAMSSCSQLNWACNFIVGLGFPYMNKYLGPYSFLPFAAVLAATFMFALTVLPETQGTTPEELATELVKNASSGVIYQTNTDSVRAIDEEWKKAMEQLMEEEEAEMDKGTYGKWKRGSRCRVVDLIYLRVSQCVNVVIQSMASSQLLRAKSKRRSSSELRFLALIECMMSN